MKHGVLYIILCLCFLSGCGPKSSNWTPYYESQYKTPYGTKVFLEQLKDIFPGIWIETIKDKTPDYLSENYYTAGTYFYINPVFHLWKDEYQWIEDMENDPNDAFICTSSSIAEPYKRYGIKVKRTREDSLELKLKNLKYDEEGASEKSYTIIHRRPSQTYYFSKIPDYATILGTIEVDGVEQPNYIGLYKTDSEAALYFHSQPDLFSNYHMLNGDDGLYALNSMSHLRYTDYIYWDGYGTARRYRMPPSDGGTSSLLRYIKSSGPLTYAMFTLISLALLFFIVNYKRIIRPAEILRPVKNSSIDYINIIAALFEGENNKLRAAQYRTNYILDRIKAKYHLDTTELNDEFLNALAIKSEVDESGLRSFIYQLRKTRDNMAMDSEEFLDYNKAIEDGINLINLNQ